MRRALHRVRRAVTRRLWQATAGMRAERAGVLLGPENWCIRRGAACEVAIDVGVGKWPTFAPWIQDMTGAKVVLCDPTPKHIAALQGWVAKTPGTYLLERAVAAEDGVVSFYESDNEESGSIADGHVNRRGPGRMVTVPSVSLGTLVDSAARHGKVGLVKLDIEGAEFDLLRNDGSTAGTLARVPQWILEFHPIPQTDHTLEDVREACNVFRNNGFRAFSRNGVDFLFWRPMEEKG